MLLAFLLHKVGQLWYVKILLTGMSIILPYYIATLFLDMYRYHIGRSIPKLIDEFRSSFIRHNKIRPALKESSLYIDKGLGGIIARASDSTFIEKSLDTLKQRFDNVWFNIYVALLLNYKENGGELIDQLYRLNRTMTRYNNCPFSFQVILLILLSFWLPELVLFIKRLLLGNKYRKEVIKLENIFELHGSIRNFKTIDILEEMAKASRTYRKHLDNCRELFKTEKEQALQALKASVKNTRFSRLVDILRVYSMTDKKLALQIMERNMLEKEEELLMTAEEDIDLVDLIAFISIVPILLQLANLLLKPMLDMIYEAFRFI
jgi:hypothetical protein